MARNPPSSASSKTNSPIKRSEKSVSHSALRPSLRHSSKFPRRGWGFIEALAVTIPILAIYLLWLFIDHCDEQQSLGAGDFVGYSQSCFHAYQCCRETNTGRPQHFQIDVNGKSDIVINTREDEYQHSPNIEQTAQTPDEDIKALEDRIDDIERTANLKQRDWITKQLGQLYMTNNLKLEIMNKILPDMKEVLADIECLDACLHGMSQLRTGGVENNKKYFEKVYRIFDELFHALSKGSRCRKDRKQIKKRMREIGDRLGLQSRATWLEPLE